MRVTERERYLQSIDREHRELLRLKKYLMADVSRIAGHPGLNATHYRTLKLLDDRGADCMKNIHNHLGLEAGSFTPVADRLIAEGLIERQRDAKDRRRILLHLTESGHRTVENIKVIVRNQIQEKLSGLEDGILRELAEAMESIRRVNDILQGSGNEQKHE